MVKIVLFAHLMQLDGTLYVMLQNVFKNQISLIFVKRDILESIPKTKQQEEKATYLFVLNVSIELVSPLSLCVDWTQSNNATMSQTVASLCYFYHFYFNHCSDSGVYMIHCIGHCWKYLDKQAYLIAYFLDLKF